MKNLTRISVCSTMSFVRTIMVEAVDRSVLGFTTHSLLMDCSFNFVPSILHKKINKFNTYANLHIFQRSISLLWKQHY